MDKEEALQWFMRGALQFDASAIMRKDDIKKMFEIEWEKEEELQEKYDEFSDKSMNDHLQRRYDDE